VARAYPSDMRIVAISAAFFLIVAAAALGSRGRAHGTGVAQTAIEAPRPPGTAKKKSGLVEQVACSSAKECAALGGWLYTEQGGKWKARKVPSLAGAGGANLRSLACATPGRCESVGTAGAQHVVHVSESGRLWRLGEVALPPDAEAIEPPSGPQPSLASVSCFPLGGCVAAGGYDTPDGTTHPLLVPMGGGNWRAGASAQLPANAATSPGPDFPGAGGGLSLVDCENAGNCTAVGTYVNADASNSDYPWVLTETRGHWAQGAEAQLPADASALGDLENGASPFFGFTGLSCPSAGNCTAVGGYEDTSGAEEGLLLVEHNGVWSRGVRAPLPPGAIPNEEPNEFNSPVTAVSCAAPGDCAAVGWYVVHSTGARHGLLLREQGGRWKAFALALPAKVKAPGGVFLTSVSCPSRGNCVAVGYYGSHGKTHGLLVRERKGKWGRAVNAALPKNAAPAGKSHTFLNSVTCPAKRFCLAGGSFRDSSNVTQGLLLNLRLS
jgi:hypothetical protein